MIWTDNTDVGFAYLRPHGVNQPSRKTVPIGDGRALNVDLDVTGTMVGVELMIEPHDFTEADISMLCSTIVLKTDEKLAILAELLKAALKERRPKGVTRGR